MKFPIRILSRSRYNALKAAQADEADSELIRAISRLFDVDGAEPWILQSDLVAAVAASSPPVILDVGANVGLWTRGLAVRFPRSAVHALEPDPRTVLQLRQNVRDLDNVVVHHVAAHSSSGRVRFHSHRNSLLSSVLVLEDSEGATEQVDVEAFTVDELVSKRLGACPALIKIDTEGHDLQVLAGASQTLANEHLRVVIMEFGLDPSTRRQVPIRQLMDVMADLDFVARDLGIAGIHRGSLYGNAVFCRASA